MRFENFLHFIWEDIKDFYKNYKKPWMGIFIVIIIVTNYLSLYHFVNPEVAFNFIKIVGICLIISLFIAWGIVFYFYLKNKLEMS